MKKPPQINMTLILFEDGSYLEKINYTLSEAKELSKTHSINKIFNWTAGVYKPVKKCG